MRSDRKAHARAAGAQPVRAPLPSTGRPTGAGVRSHALALGALWAAILLAYSNSFSAGLILDNSAIILRDPRITAAAAGNVSRILKSEYWYTQSGNGLYRPLTTLSYLFNFAVLENR